MTIRPALHPWSSANGSHTVRGGVQRPDGHREVWMVAVSVAKMTRWTVFETVMDDRPRCLPNGSSTVNRGPAEIATFPLELTTFPCRKNAGRSYLLA